MKLSTLIRRQNTVSDDNINFLYHNGLVFLIDNEDNIFLTGIGNYRVFLIDDTKLTPSTFKNVPEFNGMKLENDIEGKEFIYAVLPVLQLVIDNLVRIEEKKIELIKIDFKKLFTKRY